MPDKSLITSKSIPGKPGVLSAFTPDGGPSNTGEVFTITFHERFWRPGIFKMPWPLVTSCCITAAWFHAISQDGKKAVDVCQWCGNVAKVDFMTVEQYNQKFSSNATQEYLESIWEKPSQQQK